MLGPMPIDELLAGAPGLVRGLANNDDSLWKDLLEYAIKHRLRAAPSSFVTSLLAVEPDVERWFHRARSRAAIIDSPHFERYDEALNPFRAWLMAGVTSGAHEGSAAALFAELEALATRTGSAALEPTRALVAKFGVNPALQTLRARALLLLAQRAFEAGTIDEAEVAAREAEPLLSAAHYVRDALLARRVRGAALLRQHRFAEAFEVLDGAMDSSGPDLVPVPPPRRSLATSLKQIGTQKTADPGAIEELASVATWARSSTPEWVCALGCVAEAYAQPTSGQTEHVAVLRERFAAALGVMTYQQAVSLHAALFWVIDQARERGMEQTAREAESRLPMRFISMTSAGGGRLTLRLSRSGSRWLRVHDNGDIEVSNGDPRREGERTLVRTIPCDDPLFRAARMLHGSVLGLAPTDLVQWQASNYWNGKGHFYPVQAFGDGGRSFKEGTIGYEVEMGVMTDVFGGGRADVDCLQRLLALLS